MVSTRKDDDIQHSVYHKKCVMEHLIKGMQVQGCLVGFRLRSLAWVIIITTTSWYDIDISSMYWK